MGLSFIQNQNRWVRVFVFILICNVAWVSHASLMSSYFSIEHESLTPEFSLEEKLGVIESKSLFYINDQYQNPEARSLQLFEGRIVRKANESDFSLGIDLEGQVSMDHQWFNSFTANEFYFRMDPIWSGTTLFLGRKRAPWSGMDDRWKLGLIQPIFRVDALNPRSQGLTGLFVDVRRDDWVVEFFGTPFFLPDHGPQVETRNGIFLKGHPWIQYPPTEVIIKGEVVPAYYRIDKPSIPDVIVNTGYGAHLQWGHSDQPGWQAQLSWSYKPMNQLLLGYGGNLRVGAADQVEIDVHPEVGFHEVASIDIAYQTEDWRIYLGAITDRPSETTFESPWTYQIFNHSNLVGMGFDLGTDRWRLGAHYLHCDGGQVNLGGPYANASFHVLPDRFDFEDLVKTEVQYRRPLKGDWVFDFHTEWKRELNESSDILSTQAGLTVGPFWKVYAGTDLLQTQNRKPGKIDFIESYQANDRVYGGVQYVF